MNILRAAVGLCAFALLTAAAKADPAKVKDAEVKTPISVSGLEGLKTAALKKIRVTATIGEKVGDFQTGWMCAPQGNFILGTKLIDVVTAPAGRVFNKQLAKAGYPSPNKNDSVFDTQAKQSAEYEVGASMGSMQLNLCTKSQENWGGVWLQVRWEVFSPRLQKVLLDITTEGSFQNTAPEKITLTEMIERAYVVAADNLFAEQKFVDLMAGPAPEAPAAVKASTRIPTAKEPAGGVNKNATLLRSAVATIETGRASGSGFFISRDGYLLTNQHVVRDAKFIKVKLATGRELVGEVLRSDTGRDVALVKTEQSGIEPLAIRTTEANVGEDVYAIGSPLGDKFSGSVTKGVLAGHRVLSSLRYLQSDASILPGSSGGPLLDASGKVIGIAARALDSGRANLNLFIPIAEALEKLSTEIEP